MNERWSGLYNLVNGVALLLVLANSTVFAQSMPEHSRQMTHRVMPFSLSKTMHIFKMTESGGIQRVIARDPRDSGQIALIQRHLKHEATKFAHGDYSDPATLHGANMPGLRELSAGAADIRISYAALAAGAAITFETTDLHLLTAIHRWFGAQLSAHGADALAE